MSRVGDSGKLRGRGAPVFSEYKYVLNGMADVNGR